MQENIARGETADTEKQNSCSKTTTTTWNVLGMKCIRYERTVKTTECKDSYIIINYVGNVATKWDNTFVLSTIIP